MRTGFGAAEVNVSGSLDYQAVIGRKNLDEGTFGMSLRVTF